MSEGVIKGKINLLSQPLAYDPASPRHGVRGGYLPGYLAVKNARLALILRGCTALEDTDLYLAFTRAYFFEDYGLVDAVLKSAVAETTYTESAVNYFAARFVSFIQDTTPNDIAQFEARVLAQTSSLDITSGQSTPAARDADIRAGARQFEALTRELDGTAPHPLVDKILAADRWTISQRHVVCAATFTDKVRINNDRVMVGERPDDPRWFRADFPKRAGAPDGEGEGRVQCFMMLDLNVRIVTVALNDAIVAVHFLEELPVEYRNDFVHYTTNSDKLRDDQAMAQELSDRILSELGMDEYYASLVKQAAEAASNFYCHCSVMFTDQSHRAAARQKMSDVGYYALVGRDFSVLEALSAAAIAASLNPSSGFVETLLARGGHSLDDLTAQCSAASAAADVPLLTHDNGSLVSFV